ncbi:hypothetical protein IQ249_06735 [Lusitaniella coriacea LEGE 07157]|uniref:Uncharacterized protein n=1 Tax=Lusitaniella coriacea LEGE 07157 TaxID=945747 RepID=A0A8J7J9I8_9CYAN|nr:hypothetical protein [Lusitaniella coriacea]MBE9115590.1 hypothetical protein [Lusitaniella coriacea LEGE 07157]
MIAKLQLIPGAISEILVSATETGMLTLADRYGLMAAILDESLDEEEQRAVNRIVRSVLRGRLRIQKA